VAFYKTFYPQITRCPICFSSNHIFGSSVFAPEEQHVYKQAYRVELLAPLGVAPACKNPADNKMKLRIEQVGKGGLPPLFPDHLDWARAGVNHPFRLVQFKCLFFLPGDFGVSKKRNILFLLTLRSSEARSFDARKL